MDNKHIDSWLKSRKNRKNAVAPDALFEGIQSGEMSSLSAAITLL